MDEGLWYCVECGCIDVEECAWVLMNTAEISGGEAPVTHWCPECRSHEVMIDFAVGGRVGAIQATEFGDRRLHPFEGDAIAQRDLP
jgi:hypothetical protein